MPTKKKNYDDLFAKIAKDLKPKRSRKKAVELPPVPDPEYYYVKGEGWIPLTTPPPPQLTEIIGKYKVTLIQRRPERGENYFTNNGQRYDEEGNLQRGEPMEMVMNSLKEDYWRESLETESYTELTKHMIARWTRDAERYDRHNPTIVCKLEKLTVQERLA